MGYFSQLTTQKANISTISGVVNIIEGFGKAHVLLPGVTNLKIENALYSPKSQRNLLNFKDIQFSALGGGTKQLDNQNEISWNELSYLDPQTKQCELKVQKIIHLQGLANQLPDTFTDPKRVTKSHVPAANAPIKIDVPEGQDNMSNESRARQKRGRPLGSKDKNPRKKKGANNQDGHIEVNETLEKSHEETLDMMVPEEPQVLKRFYMDKSHPLSTPMVVRSLDVEKDHFQPPTDDEYILGPEVQYLSAIGALMFLADVGYLSDPYTGRSQTGYVFSIGGTAISWRSTKQTMVATSSNHAEILDIHECDNRPNSALWLAVRKSTH
ncbi:hypothetical protein OSB04_028920 [Centaurea solstitialis]|uniref:Uncharacterized protein n=1 Tax=Centaurea solstitialis TaxID=347529 RepID=A0AA38SGM2_9ASTR|nr:hypothetical protein OSB04_028920 [Centaurea solstitialis]